jgi:hypothetical protein
MHPAIRRRGQRTKVSELDDCQHADTGRSQGREHDFRDRSGRRHLPVGWHTPLELGRIRDRGYEWRQCLSMGSHIPQKRAEGFAKIARFRRPGFFVNGLYQVHSFEQNLGHHALVFVIEKMAMKDGHTLNHGVGKIHDDVD